MIAHYYLGLINMKLNKITSAFSYYTKVSLVHCAVNQNLKGFGLERIA